jgi:hypothetical protein
LSLNLLKWYQFQNALIKKIIALYNYSYTENAFIGKPILLRDDVSYAPSAAQ